MSARKTIQTKSPVEESRKELSDALIQAIQDRDDAQEAGDSRKHLLASLKIIELQKAKKTR